MIRTLFFVLAFIPAAAQSVSFNCAKATSQVERLICASSEVSRLDDTLSQIFDFELEQEESFPGLKSTQKTWLARRNTCTDVNCIKYRYEQRIAEIACSPKSRMIVSAIGSNQCAYFSLLILDRELSSLNERYDKRVSELTNNPEYTKETLLAERKAWISYRAARCSLHGATEGGSDGWKNAFAGLCEVDETEKRIARFKHELVEK